MKHSRTIRTICIVCGSVFLAACLFIGLVYVSLFVPNFTRRKSMVYTEKDDVEHWKNAEYQQRFYAESAWWESTDRVRLEITSYDGLKLVAYYLPCENQKGIVLMMHGFHSTPMRDFAAIAHWYYEQGYAICLPYQRAHGESEGSYLTFGVKERYDVRDWVQELNTRFGMEQDIWVHGISMGCATVVMGSGLDYPFNVRGVIADCGFTSPYAIMEEVLHHRKIPFVSLMLSIGDIFAKRLAGFSLHEYDTFTALRTNETPMLFIHGTADDFVPPYMTIANYEACHAPKELVLVEDGIHAISFYKDEELYTKSLTKFLDKYALVY